MTTYSAIVEGKQYCMVVDKWIPFLKDKQIYAHYGKTKIHRLLRIREDHQKGEHNKLTISQCLGIKAIDKPGYSPGKDKHKFNKSEQVVYDKVLELRQGLNEKIRR